MAFVAQAVDANGDGGTHPLGERPHPRRLFAQTHLCNRLRVRTGRVGKINLDGQEFGEICGIAHTVDIFPDIPAAFPAHYYQTQ